MTKAQKFYKIAFITLNSVLTISAILSIVLSLIYLGGNSNDFTDITSLIYGFFHLIIVVFTLGLSIKGYKRGYAIFQTLSHKEDYKDEISVVARIVGIAVGVLGLVMFIINLISIANSQYFLPDLSLVLKMDLVQVGIYLFTIATFFIFYPILGFKEEIKDIKKE